MKVILKILTIIVLFASCKSVEQYNPHNVYLIVEDPVWGDSTYLFYFDTNQMMQYAEKYAQIEKQENIRMGTDYLLRTIASIDQTLKVVWDKNSNLLFSSKEIDPDHLVDFRYLPLDLADMFVDHKVLVYDKSADCFVPYKVSKYKYLTKKHGRLEILNKDKSIIFHTPVLRWL